MESLSLYFLVNLHVCKGNTFKVRQQNKIKQAYNESLPPLCLLPHSSWMPELSKCFSCFLPALFWVCVHMYAFYVEYILFVYVHHIIYTSHIIYMYIRMRYIIISC